MLVLGIFILLSSIGFAEENFDEAITAIQSNVPCAQLTDTQLEEIGDYYMEQMHPGELHERMDSIMGGEGSESLRNAHINMAKMFYCGEQNAMSMSMMNMMMGRTGNMMGNNLDYGMMGSWGYSWWRIFFMIICWGAIIWLIVWLIRKTQEGSKESPVEIAKRRFAKGEITKKEFEEIKKLL